MERFSEVVGLPVICIDNGKQIGIVDDVVFCPRTKEIKAFLLQKKGLDRKVIMRSDVLNLGKDALIINAISAAKSFRSLKNSYELKERGEVNGLRIYSRTGQDIGTVKDILFDYATGNIEGVEVSDGLLQDIVQGRRILPLFGKVEFSSENILVDKEALEEMTGTGGGLKNLLLDNKTEDKK